MKLNDATAVFFSVLALLAASPYSSAAGKVIYGEDDRLEYYEVPENFKAAADATASLWKKQRVKLDYASGKYSLVTMNFGDIYNLCPEVKFREQPSGASCSGALVGEDLVLTAGHCIKSKAQCDDTSFVFGYSIGGPVENARTQLSADEVYSCSEVIKRSLLSTTLTVDGESWPTVYGQDIALIKLDRKVTGRKPLAINRRGGIKKGDRLFAAGHPNGLPFKFSADGAVMVEVDPDSAYFVSNLDVFGGNSGGPVFNAQTGLIEGIVARSDPDHFIPSFLGCTVYNVRPQTAGFGTDVNKLDEVISEIPLTPGEAAAEAGIQSDLDALRGEVPLRNDLNINF
ncbi:MAG: serine protease [Elusimicrobiota bacterium]